MSTINTFGENVLQLVSKGNLKEALGKVQKILKASPLLDEVILQSSRYSDVMKSIRMGIINYEDANLEKNKIKYALIDIVREMEEASETNADLKQEIASHLESSSMTISNELNVTGNENVNIQGSSGVHINMPKKIIHDDKSS